MDVQKLIGSNIKKYRLAASISQEELAARIDVDQAYVSRLEAGQKNPTVATVNLVANALGVDLKVLFDKHK
jgi:transcriptional regulator with XRE-family HTH domain